MILRTSFALVALAGCAADSRTSDAGPDVAHTEPRDAARDDIVATVDAGALDVATDAPVAVWPAPMRAGACTRVRSNLHNNTWETATVYDPRSRSIVWSGGHVLNSYVQSAYTVRLPTEDFRTVAVRPRRPPQRRCLVDATYADSIGRAVYAHGYIDHGSINPGNFLDNWTRVGLAETPGPWLFDATRDEWIDARPVGNRFDQRHHAPMTWDAATDTVYSLRDDALQLYNARTNSVATRALPAALHRRMFYAIAADPVAKRLVVFGGSTGQFRYLTGDVAANYDANVHHDTWLYDPASDRWEALELPEHPPRGVPSVDFTDIPAVWESQTGNVLVRVTPLDRWVADPTMWPDAETWAFNVVARRWTRLSLADAPKFMGLLNYDTQRQRLVIVGGGRDAGARPALSRELFDCTLPTAGAALEPMGPPSLRVESVAPGHNVVRWEPVAGREASVWRAVANPVPSAFSQVGSVMGEGELVDRSAPAGVAVVYEVRVAGLRPAAPATNQARWPEGLTASVESASRVVLRWQRSAESDVVGYKLYRARAGANGMLISSAMITASTFTDNAVDLSDGAVRRYWVTAVNRGGVESGASPQAYTFPEAPLSAEVSASAPGVFEITWNWPAEVRVSRFDVYHVNVHQNTNSQSDPFGPMGWYGRIASIVPERASGGSFTFRADPTDTSPHHYFWVKAVNVLEQRGFVTDIISASDARFVPHTSSRYAPE